MLYVKFKIQDEEKFADFQKLYEHLVKVRQEDFEFYEDKSDLDWDNMTAEEMDKIFETMFDKVSPEAEELKRYEQNIPSYSNAFFESYIKGDDTEVGNLDKQEVLSIFHYLEFDFEVDFNKLSELQDNLGIVEFSTGNFPFGGLEQFFITLRSFDLIPTSCFDGFSVNEINWTSNFEYDLKEQSKQTKVYLKKFEN